MNWPAISSRSARTSKAFVSASAWWPPIPLRASNAIYCKRGLENLCEDLLFNNGAYAEYIRIPARIVKRNMYEIPAHVSYQDAALIEPLACVMRGLEETHVRPGDQRRCDRPRARSG